MSIASIKAGKAFYEIFADDKTGKGIASAESRLAKLGARIGVIGAAMQGVAVAGLTAIGAMVKGFANAGDDIADQMAVTGLSGGFLQALQFAAADAGVTVDALTGSLSKMASVIADAANGSSGAQASLARLGLTAQQLLAMSPDDRLKAIADGLASISDPGLRAAAAIDILGKSGAKLLPVLENGAAGLAAMQAEMESRGLVLSKEDIALAMEANGAFLMLSKTFSHIVNLIGAAAAPVFLPFLNVLQSGAELVARFVNENRALVAGLTTVLGIVGVVGGALMILGTGMTLLSMATAGWAVVTAVVASPIFLIASAIVACGTAAGVAAYQLDQLFNNGEGFKAIAGAAQQAADMVKLFGQSIMAGEWNMVFEFIGTALEHAFDSAILGVKQSWIDLMTLMSNSNPFASDQFKATLSEDLQNTLTDDRAAALDSATRLANLAAKMGALGTSRKTDLPSSRMMFDSASSGLRDIQTAGFLSSSAVGRIAQSAPGNQFTDKQDKLIEIGEKQQGTLEDLLDVFSKKQGLLVE